MCHMKRLSERPAESRKPLTKFYGITASESELLPLKTDKSTKTQRTTSNGGLSLPCSSSALMNSHTKKLNNRRPSQRHTMTGNQKKISCFFALIFGIFKNRQYCAVQRGIRKKSSLPFGKSASCPWRADKEKMCPVCLAVFNFWWCGK